MLRLVFCAFIAARLTNFGADAADRGGKLRTARHQACCSRAHGGAGAIQLNAMGHHFYILLMQAFRRAIFASNHAVITRVDTALIFFVWHTQLSNALACSFSLEKHSEFNCDCRNSNDAEHVIGSCRASVSDAGVPQKRPTTLPKRAADFVRATATTVSLACLSRQTASAVRTVRGA